MQRLRRSIVYVASHQILLRAPPRNPVRRTALYRIQRFFAIIGFTAFFGIAIIVARIFGMEMPWQQGVDPQSANPMTTQNVVIPIFNDQVAIISGHSGNDSGAVCDDDAGNAILTEAEINADVANRAAELLRSAGTDVMILEEYDPRLVNLQVNVLLSLHADSCIDASGYKAAYYSYSAIPDVEARLLECIDYHYPAVTGLSQHANTVTHDMTEYHAFRKVAPSTPAVIVELGFLGGDQDLLKNHADVVARGVVDSILCFLTDTKPIPTEPIPDEPIPTDPS